jgi:hypothetical protein
MDSYSIELIMEGLAWLGFFAAIILSFYFYLRFRNKERMALVEKGVDVSEIFKSRDFSFKIPWLRLGMLAIGVGFGILVGYLVIVLVPQKFAGNNQQFISLILMFSLLIFGGVGIILGNFIEKSRNKKNG